MPAACSRRNAVRDVATRACALHALPLALAAGLVVAGYAFAAPDEELLGKAEGYPVCPPSLFVEPRCLIGYVSRRDETADAHTILAGSVARPLARAPVEPALRYTHQTATGGLDEFLARNRTTGLLILKGDTILAERYQYDRSPEHRMTSFSMAKTVVAMLVGIAIAEGSIKSIDDRAEKYVPELKGTPFGETSIRHLLTMSSGIKFSETYGGTDDVADARAAVAARRKRRRRGDAHAVPHARTPARHEIQLLVGGHAGAGTGRARSHRPDARRLPVAEDLAADGRRGRRDVADRPRRLRDRLRGHQRDAARLRALRQCCWRTTARSTAGRSFRRDGCARRPRRRRSSSRLRTPA